MASASADVDMSSWLKVKKSKVAMDLIKFPNMEWYDDPGWGLFQLFDGMLPIKFLDAKGRIVSKLKSSIKKGSQQYKYAVESAFDEDYYIVPTKESIDSCDVPFPFRVQHESDFPSHKLDWVVTGRDYPHSYPVLKPIRPLKSGNEITFTYR